MPEGEPHHQPPLKWGSASKTAETDKMKKQKTRNITRIRADCDVRRAVCAELELAQRRSSFNKLRQPSSQILRQQAGVLPPWLP
mmetsp:Transcript_74654/g.213879  ORF Transcript_74654/g.213879 Transcript_74654/m.213879 type:complete len:84 (-) Transcript_74654:1218-1469(-)